MNTTFSSYTMDVAPLCIAPFSVSDFIHNPTCYTEPLLENLSDLLKIYIRLNRLATQQLFGLIAEYWLPALYVATFCFVVFGIVKIILLEDNEEPLTLLESEIVQSIYSNASTGCTARMLHEHLYGFYENRNLEMHEISKALQTLRRRGMVIPVQATLWLTTGK